MIKDAVLLTAENEITSGNNMDALSIIGDRLSSVDVRVAAILAIGDGGEKWLPALRQARDLGDLIIGTGKAGRAAAEAVAEFLGRRVARDASAAEALKRRLEARGVVWNPDYFDCCQFPEGAAILDNPAGTAPGFRISLDENKALIWLPGIADEIEPLLDGELVPWVARENGNEQQAVSCTFKIYGIEETRLAEIIAAMHAGPDAKFSIRTFYPDLGLRLTARGPEKEKLMATLCDRISALLHEHIYARDETTLEEILGRVLVEKSHTLALAESCTGGYISHRITRVAGSSAYYYGGAVTYSNAAKISFLGVAPETLQAHGAVSRETALEMSQGIKNKTGATIGFSITGIAGPGGGSPEKPVGTVWMSIAREHHHEARLFHFQGDREHIILGASQTALYWLRTDLLA